VLPELGLNTQFSGSTPDAVTALLIAPDTRLRAAPYRESGLVHRPEAETQVPGVVLPVLRRVSDAGPFAMFGGTVGPASESLQRRNPRDGREGFTAYGDLRAGRVAPVMRRSAEQGMAEPRQRWE
jgi:hypothetical protein